MVKRAEYQFWKRDVRTLFWQPWGKTEGQDGNSPFHKSMWHRSICIDSKPGFWLAEHCLAPLRLAQSLAPDSPGLYLGHSGWVIMRNAGTHWLSLIVSSIETCVGILWLEDLAVTIWKPWTEPGGSTAAPLDYKQIYLHSQEKLFSAPADCSPWACLLSLQGASPWWVSKHQGFLVASTSCKLLASKENHTKQINKYSQTWDRSYECEQINLYQARRSYIFLISAIVRQQDKNMNMEKLWILLLGLRKYTVPLMSLHRVLLYPFHFDSLNTSGRQRSLQLPSGRWGT